MNICREKNHLTDAEKISYHMKLAVLMEMIVSHVTIYAIRDI